MGWKSGTCRLALLGMMTAAFALRGGMAAADSPAQTTVAKASPLPVEAFAELPTLENPVLSPNGLSYAAKAAIGGKQIVVIQKAGKLAVVNLTDIDLRWLRWVNDDWLIAGLGNTAPVEGESWYLTRVAAISADGKTINVLGKKLAAQHADDVLWIARDGSPRILLSLQQSIYSNSEDFWPSVFEVNVSNGRMRQVVKPRETVMDWYADASGCVRMGYGYRDLSRTARLLARPDCRSNFREIDRANLRKSESLIVPDIFLADTTKAIVVAAPEGFAGVYHYDLSKLELGEKLFSVDGYDVDAVASDEAGSALGAAFYTDQRSRVQWFDPTRAEVQADIDKAVGPARTATIVSSSRDFSNMLVSVGGPDRPPTYYFYNINSGRMTRIDATYPQLSKVPLSPVKTIRYKARDGQQIEAVLTVPRGRDTKSLPLILMPHGGPAARDSEEWDWIVQFLANRGYAVLQPNYRGSTGYGRAFEKLGDGQWGLAMQDDLNDAVDWAAKEGIVDPARVCIAGASYGGYAAMRGAQRDGGRYRCAISYAGVSDLNGMLRYDSRFLNGGSSSDGWREYAPDTRAVSPLNFPEQFSTPILLMHGKKDLRVPVSQSRKMADKLKSAGKPYIYIEQPEGDHHFSRQADRLQFLKEMEAFLQKYNPAG